MSSTEQHAKSLLHSEYVGTHSAFKRAAIETRSSLEMDTISLKTFTELPSVECHEESGFSGTN
jgi:hypothetical protein